MDVISSKRVLGGHAGTRHNFLTSFLLCFGGGVLLATTMIHLLPEISHNLEEAAESGVESVMNRRRKYEKKNKALEDDQQGQAELSEQK